MTVDTRVVAAGRVDRLRWRAFADRAAMGVAATAYVEGVISAMLAAKERAGERASSLRIIFSAAPSQDELLAGLAGSSVIDWSRITAFHMDEYIGISPDASQGFGRFLRDRLFDRVPIAKVHYLDVSVRGMADAASECRRYGELLAAAPMDLCCLGVGENGHLAFNDPPVADFEDPVPVKMVQLDDLCRRQQVNDGCFATLGDVPTHAMTLTVPALMAAMHLVCVVPAPTKRNAVRRLLGDAEISTSLPAGAMRRHPSATLFLDADSYGVDIASCGDDLTA